MKEKAPEELAKLPGGLVPARDFANIMRVTTGYISGLARKGVLQSTKISGRWFVYVSAYGRQMIEKQKEAQK